MTLKYKKVACPFCEGKGSRESLYGDTPCPGCNLSGTILVGSDGNIYDKIGGKPLGTWGGQYAVLEEQGIPDIQG